MVADALRAKLPPELAHRVAGPRTSCSRWASTSSASASPTVPGQLLLGLTTKHLGDAAWSRSTSPRPTSRGTSGSASSRTRDLFRRHPAGDGEVVTDHIDGFVPEGIRLKTGRMLEADVVVSATGLTLKPFGGVALTVDGQTVDLHEQSPTGARCSPGCRTSPTASATPTPPGRCAPT